MRTHALAAALIFGLGGCFAPPSSAQRLTDTALNMNVATRFGRMDIAIEHVDPTTRAAFARRHVAWGAAVRVVELDFNGFERVGRDEADVLLNISWLRHDEATVRVTRVVQRWRDERGQWQLVDEKRKDGDIGLLGEQPPAPASPAGDAGASPRQASFQTRVIREE